MNKSLALEILDDVYSYSTSSLEDYGVSLIREALRYLDNLNNKRSSENYDYHLYGKICKVRDKLPARRNR